MAVAPMPGLAAPPAALRGMAAPTFDRLFDFPTLQAGDTFKIVKGSEINGFNVKGSARLDALTPNSAEVWLKVGKFGISREGTLAIEQTSAGVAHIDVRPKGRDPQSGDAEIVDVRTNRTELRGVPGGAYEGAALLQVNDRGQFIVDVQGSDNGAMFGDVDAHLVLEPS